MPAAVMIDYLNTIACVLLLLYALPVSSIMVHRGQWLSRRGMWRACGALMVQASGPEWLEVPRAPWPQALLNWVIVARVTIWRRELMAFVRCKFGPPPKPSDHPNLGRRHDDIERLGHNDLHHVPGGSKQ